MENKDPFKFYKWLLKKVNIKHMMKKTHIYIGANEKKYLN